MNFLLDNRNEIENYNELYWGVPNYLHHWNAKKSEMFSTLFLDEVKEVEFLKEALVSVKETEIVKDYKETSKEKSIINGIKDYMERQQKNMIFGEKLVEYFGKLPVSVNAHYVTNDKGTTFVRCFFYMYGKLTPLNTIISIIEKQKS